MSTLATSSRITPFLWFDANAEEAANFYVSIFPNSRILSTNLRVVDDPSGTAGSVLTVAFELDGVRFTALNGGPIFKFNESVSFVVHCANQQEIDHYWAQLTAGGAESQCGWLKDKYGLSWQIVPARLSDHIRNPKAMQAMLQMKKFNIAELERAAQS